MSVGAPKEPAAHLANARQLAIRLWAGKPSPWLEKLALVFLALWLAPIPLLWFGGINEGTRSAVVDIMMGVFLMLFGHIADRVSGRGQWETGPWYRLHPILRGAISIAGVIVFIAGIRALLAR